MTGAGRDIGRACAVKLASEGANIVFNYFQKYNRRPKKKTVADIEAVGGKVIAVQGDLNKQEDVKEKLVDTAMEQFGSIDVLVNNTGGLVSRKKIAEMVGALANCHGFEPNKHLFDDECGSSAHDKRHNY